MNISKHIVTSANWDSGRAGKQITGIVLHTMVGYLQGSEDTFKNPAIEVSVHYGIGMDGSIRQWVEEKDTAYQAGNLQVNLTTIGIEHEDYADANDSTRTPALYEASASLVADICKRYGFPADTDHIFLHKNVIDTSVYKGGTACPDGLDTNKIISLAAAKLKGNDMTLSTSKEVVQIWAANGVNRGPAIKEVQEAMGRTLEDYMDYFLTLPFVRDNLAKVKYYDTDVKTAANSTEAAKRLEEIKAQIKQLLG